MARLIQPCLAKSQICNLSEAPYNFDTMPLNTACTTDTAYHVHTVWAVPLSLATTRGIAICFLFLEVLRCFSSLGWPLRPMDSAGDYLGLPGRVAPFGNPRVSLPPACRGISQVSRVLHRLSVPRHPPHALTSLAETLDIRHDVGQKYRIQQDTVRLYFDAWLHQPLHSTVKERVRARSGAQHKRICIRGALAGPRPTSHGGDDRDRTDGLRLAKPALSQLSYIPARLNSRMTPVDTQHAARGRHVYLPWAFTKWWARVESNYPPHAYQACALTN